MFVLDQSTSLKHYDSQVKGFVSRVAGYFPISPKQVQIGIVTFGSIVKNEFNLNRYSNYQALLQGISQIKYLGGSTMTYLALDYLRLHSFRHRFGDRNGVANIAIIITDGKSSNYQRTIYSAKLLKESGVQTYVVAIGNNVGTQEPKLIASSPSYTHVFIARNIYNMWQTYKYLIYNTCGQLSNPCLKRPCKNGGRCERRSNTFVCSCPTGFSGLYCQTINPCQKRPCKNGGHCVNKGSEFQCKCQPGYTGHVCHTYNYCHKRPCKNRASCVNTVSGFQCKCLPGYTGHDCGKSTYCKDVTGDIMFVLDQSTSLKHYDSQIKGFVSRVAGYFPISPKQVQIGVVTFGSIVKNEFNLNRYSNYQALLQGISQIKYLGGSTMTYLALDYLRLHSFRHRFGDRNGVPNIAIIITDGKSSNYQRTIYSAKLLKESGVQTYVVAIGNNVGTQEPKLIASSPSYTHVFIARNIYNMWQTHKYLIYNTCGQLSNPCLKRPCKNGGRCERRSNTFVCSCPTGFSGLYCQTINPCQKRPCKNGGHCVNKGSEFQCKCQPGYTGHVCHTYNYCHKRPCKNRASCVNTVSGFQCKCLPGYTGHDCGKSTYCKDVTGDIMFVLDQSTSLKHYDSQIKGFVSRVAGYFPISPKQVQIGVVTFGSIVKNEFNLNRYSNYQALLQGISQIKYLGGSTMTYLALDYLRLHSFRHRFGDRNGVANIAIIITDGKSSNYQRTIYSAKLLKESGVQTYVVAIGNNVGTHEPKLIASSPSHTHVFIARNIYNLWQTHKYLIYNTCGQLSDPCMKRPCKNGGRCKRQNNSFACICPSGSSGKYCQTNNPCHKRPCKNGARCVDKGSGFQCKCQPGYAGHVCSKYNHCHKRPCKNGGHCVNKGSGFQCQCQPGYTGHDCGKYNPCHKRPCNNGGNCVNNGSGFQCKCLPGYTGHFCSKYDPCSNSPCKNNGTCINQGSTFICQCQGGFRGKICDLPPPCSSNPCRNGGRCSSAKDDFICQCPPIYRGKDCSIVVPCGSVPCKNNGTCTNNGKNYTCQCPPQFNGNECEKEKSVCRCTTFSKTFYRTFDDQILQFTGPCNETLVRPLAVSKMEDFSVKIIKKKSSMSTVNRIVEVKLNNNVILFSTHNTLSVNYEKRTLPIITKDFSVQLSVGWVSLNTRWGLSVKYDGIHQVEVTLPISFAEKVTGICGDCNGKEDDLKSRVLRNYANTVNSAKSPKVPCKPHSALITCHKSQSLKCDSIFNMPMFKECIEKIGKSNIAKIQMLCSASLCSGENDAKENDKLCHLVETFASECQKADVLVRWRSAKFCPKLCPVNQEYKTNISICQPTCINKSPNCTTYTAGCVCKPGFILSGRDCVLNSECGCFRKGIYMRLHEEIYSSTCLEKSVCLEGGKIKIIKAKACQENSECKIDNGKRHCACNDGYSQYKGKCEKLGLGISIRVQKASLQLSPYYTYHAHHPNDCVRKCKHVKECMSVNYDNKNNICELLSGDATADNILKSDDCEYKDYYQMKNGKTVIINGAELSSCEEGKFHENINTVFECRNICRAHNCSGFEFSAAQKHCYIIPATQAFYDLFGRKDAIFVGNK
ncbi:hypothetical protein Ahia01_000930800 [Argonauta hians]